MNNPNLGRQWGPDPAWADVIPLTPRPVSQRNRMRDEGRLAVHAQDSVAEAETLGYKTETKSYYHDNTKARVADHETDWKRYSASQ